MSERTLLRNSCYVIPMREKLSVHIRRLVLIPYLFLRYAMRRFIPTEMENSGDVVRTYVRDHEAKRTLRALGIQERDATAAIKAATYMHNLTHPLGDITEMTPQRSVRIEKHCPFARFLSPDKCRDLISGPAFRGLCEAIHPNLIHTHTEYLSGGDDMCDLVFELKE
ncbi:MAG: hypothetical protein C4532_10215 [Candidatus Abyssobacteria bacterium SURF_17]|uniref:Metanogen output domain-containing protein n=1 Tax=Candidatus Abyssobacteria bacterium SURF_17 TaxID=2093361 RepID=A0A419EY52_9BACT|nr:MAG: hypothetical protein C4532_10215 [Candidatus Abyssubacteria bacterium SURF_17]